MKTLLLPMFNATTTTVVDWHGWGALKIIFVLHNHIPILYELKSCDYMWFWTFYLCNTSSYALILTHTAVMSLIKCSASWNKYTISVIVYANSTCTLQSCFCSLHVFVCWFQYCEWVFEWMCVMGSWIIIWTKKKSLIFVIKLNGWNMGFLL